MNANANIILEKIKGMPIKTIGYKEAEMSIDEFEQAINHIKQRGLLKLVPVYENGQIVMIKVLDK